MSQKELKRKDLLQLNSLELIAKQVVEGFITGMHKSPFHGFSVEFAEHRLYNPGDSTKNIDWKLYAKTDRLYQKKYEEETNLRCQLVIDTSSSMFYPLDRNEDQFNKLEFSVYSAASIMLMMQKQRDAVGLTLFSNAIHEHTECKSTHGHIQRLMDLMQIKMDEAKKDNVQLSNAVDVIHQVAEQVHKRSLVIIFSDMFDGVKSADEFRFRSEELIAALQHLKHNKHEVVLFHVNDPSKEMYFEFEDRPYHFIDLESKAEVKVNPKEVREAYVEKMKAYYKELQWKCGQMKIDLVKADITEGFDKVLLSYLLKRSKLH